MVLRDSDVDNIAKVCHDANRSYCEVIGDNSQMSWDEAPEWQRDSARNGVRFHLNGLLGGLPHSPSASHESWLEQKRAEGWKYGTVKNVETKEHPCFVPYNQLPFQQRRKDYLFAAICKAFADSALDSEIAA